MATQRQDPFPAETVNPNFQKLLDKFKSLTEKEPSPSKIKSELEELKKEATSTFMTFRQVDAIVGRCNHYLNGTYGSTSRELKSKETK